MVEVENEFLEEIQAGFLQEAADLVASVEGSFLELEKDPSNENEMQQILRLFHNLKGSAAAVNFGHLSEVCHKVETLLVKVRDKEIGLSSEVVELLLECTDRVNQALALLTKDRLAVLDFSKSIQKIEQLISPAAVAPITVPEIDVKQIFEKIPEALVLADENNLEAVQGLQSLLRLLPAGISCKDFVEKALVHLENVLQRKNAKEEFGAATDLIIKLVQQDVTEVSVDDPKLLQEFFTDAKEQLETIDSDLIVLEKDPESSAAIDSTFRGFHTIKSASAIVHIREIETLAHSLESFLQPIREKKINATPQKISICLEGTALIRQMIELASRGQTSAINSLSPALQSLLERIAAQDDSGSEVIVPQRGVTLEAPSQNQLHTSSVVGIAVREPLKVDADRLDRLVDSIGELVIAETMVAQAQDLKQVASASILFKHLDRLNKITRNLQEIGMSLRMVPIKQTFRKMTRIVRDLSRKLDKEIDFMMSGEDTELDRTVAEKIGDPLVHMVRNAIDHGIEKTAEERLKNGKSAVGRVELRAFHKGGNIWIEIQDDGRGLDKDVLIRKAQEKGLLRPNQVLTEQEAFQLIFGAGFSTAEKVTDVSGRGVGMDVVHKNIEELRGQVEIESVKGKGTIFRIRIPNTLAIIEGMVVRVGTERYVIPTQSIAKAIQPKLSNVIKTSSTKQEMLNFHGEIMPMFRLSQLYNIPGAVEDPTQAIVLIVEDNQRRVCLLVDQILNQQQFVMKTVGEMMKGVPGVSGGTIMPDGQVGLILDIGLLIQGLLVQKNGVNTAADAGLKGEES